MSSPDALQPTQAKSAPRPLREEVARQLDRRVEEEQARGRLPSLVVGLVRDGDLVWWSGRGFTGIAGDGPPSADTQYRIGSITKTFVAAVVLRLRDEGAVELIDRIGDHLPELAELPVTIAQLLSHTSGLRAETPGPWWERTAGMPFGDLVASSLRSQDFLWRPGRRFHYSNLGYAVLGELVARRRSAPLGVGPPRRDREPLGMRRTTMLPEPPNAQGLAVHPHVDAVLEEPAHDVVAMTAAASCGRQSRTWPGGPTLSKESDPRFSDRHRCPRWPSRWRSWTCRARRGPPPMGSACSCGTKAGSPVGPLGSYAWTLGDVADGPGNQERCGRGRQLDLSRAEGPRSSTSCWSCWQREQPRPTEAFGPKASILNQSNLELLGTWYWGPVEHCIHVRGDAHLELQGVPTGHREHCNFRPAGDGTYIGESGYFDGERLVLHRRTDGSLSYLDIASFVFTRTPYDPSADIPGGVDEKGWHAY